MAKEFMLTQKDKNIMENGSKIWEMVMASFNYQVA